MVALWKRNCLPMQETRVPSLLQEDPGEGSGNPLQYSCLENPMERGAWQATVHGVTKESDTTEWAQENNWMDTSAYTIYKMPTPEHGSLLMKYWELKGHNIGFVFKFQSEVWYNALVFSPSTLPCILNKSIIKSLNKTRVKRLNFKNLLVTQ